MSYGILAWGNANKSILKPLEILQKRAIRTINKAHFNSHTEPLFKSCEILKVADLFTYQAAMFMYDFTHGKLPLSFNKTFIYNHEIHRQLQTRQSNMVYIPMCYSQYCKRFPLYSFPRIWNSYSTIPDIHRSQFKRQVKHRFIESYPLQVNCHNARCRDCHT